ncbi:hypothetical protein [Gordonia iterans]|nr:hypothetical protein [Gordonia iterans]
MRRTAKLRARGVAAMAGTSLVVCAGTGPARADDAATSPEAMHDHWTNFIQNILTHLGALLWQGVLILAAALVLARLVAAVPGVDRKPGSRERRALIARGGAVFGIALVLFPLLYGSWRPHDAGVLVLLLALGVGAVTCFARTISTRKRVLITEVSDAKDFDRPTTPMKVAAALEGISPSSASGIEVPNGFDAHVLEGAAIFELGTSLAGKVLKAFAAIIGFAPWKVYLTRGSGENDTTVSFQITRNGRAVHCCTLHAHELSIGGVQIPPEHMVAAAILVSLAENYRNDDAWLAGATQWRSIGWTYAAATLKPGESSRISILRRAASDDHGNLQCRIAFRNIVDRQATAAEQTEEYLTWLSRMTGEIGLSAGARTPEPSPPAWEAPEPPLPPPAELLRLRVQCSAAAVSLNAVQLSFGQDTNGGAETPEDPPPQGPSEALRTAARTNTRGFYLTCFRARTRPDLGPDSRLLVEELSQVSAGLLLIAYPGLVGLNDARYVGVEQNNIAPMLTPISSEHVRATFACGMTRSTTVRYNEACRLAVTEPTDALAVDMIISLLSGRLLQDPIPLKQFSQDPFLTAFVEAHGGALQQYWDSRMAPAVPVGDVRQPIQSGNSLAYGRAGIRGRTPVNPSQAGPHCCDCCPA